MKNIAQIIEYLYPNAIPLDDFIVYDDGKNVIIKLWKVKDENGDPIPKPSQQILETNELPAAKFIKKILFKQYARNEVAAFDDQTIQHRDQKETDGVTPDLSEAEYQQVLSTKQDVRAEFKAKRNLINAALTIQEVESITWK
jgi:hypothetical protein